ncbi:MAG: RluA family pseudouridine synthase [Butyrivibrio sp.]|nr:RluA family pseudouridine synthase [Butyrivibrio sp.]
MKEILITENEAGKRLDSFLKSYLKEAGSGFIYKMLRKKNITLNGKKAEGTEKLSKGDSVKIFFSDETFEKFRGKAGIEAVSFKGTSGKLGTLPVIYEDENIVLVNKPAGVLSQKADKNDVSVNEWLIDYLLNNGSVTAESLETFRPSACNRLDRNTSGLIICAKNLAGSRVMSSLIKDREVEKYYRTLVSGKVTKSLKLTGFLYKDEATNKVNIKKEDPQDDRYSYIETEYTPVEFFADKDLTLLEVKLITGKPHQIRAHLSSIGHPIIGDVKYGGKKLGRNSYQLLHSYRLVFPKVMPSGFEHLSGKEFMAKMPDTFSNIIGDK